MATITVTEKLPHRDKYIIEFKDSAAAKKAYDDAVKFWIASNKDAVQIVGGNKIITIPTDIIASIIVEMDEPITEEKKAPVAAKKKK